MKTTTTIVPTTDTTVVSRNRDGGTLDAPVDMDWDDDSPLPPRRPKLFGAATWVLAGLLVAAGCFTLGARIGREHPCRSCQHRYSGQRSGSSCSRDRTRSYRHRNRNSCIRRRQHVRSGATRRWQQHLHPRQPGQHHQDHPGADNDDHGQQARHARRLQARRQRRRAGHRRLQRKHRRGDIDRRGDSRWVRSRRRSVKRNPCGTRRLKSRWRSLPSSASRLLGFLCVNLDAPRPSIHSHSAISREVGAPGETIGRTGRGALGFAHESGPRQENAVGPDRGRRQANRE